MDEKTAKLELRQHLRAARKAHVVTQGSAALQLQPECRAIFRSLIKKSIEVSFYQSLPFEPSLELVILSFRADGLSLPAAESRAAPLTFLRWSPSDPLVMTPLGFLQPEPEAAPVTPDLMLTPLVGFDAAGNRLGMGAGHYDRAFAANPHALRIGIAWACQQVATLPVEPWDMPLDAIFTERGIIIPPTTRITT